MEIAAFVIACIALGIVLVYQSDVTQLSKDWELSRKDDIYQTRERFTELECIIEKKVERIFDICPRNTDVNFLEKRVDRLENDIQKPSS